MHCYMNGMNKTTCEVQTCQIYPCDPGKAEKYLHRNGVSRTDSKRYKWNILKAISEMKIIINIPDILIRIKRENGNYIIEFEEV